MQVDIHQAKRELSRLLQRVALGEEITISKSGIPIARLVPVLAKGKRPLELFKGQIWIADDFDAPLPPDVLAGFVGDDKPTEQSAGRAVKSRKKRVGRQFVSKRTP